MVLALGLAERPLGTARWNYVNSGDLYRAILDGEPYKVRGLIGFGANLLLSHAGGGHGRKALAALDFYAHADLFLNPTAELADVVLPIASAFEREALRIGFEISEDAQSLIQFRQAVAPPPGEARADTDFVFDFACRLGLGAQFWHGDVEAAYRHQLGPSGCESAWGPDADRRASHLIYLTRVWSAARAYQQADGAIKPGWPVDVAAVLGRNFNSILQNQRGALALFAGKVGRFDLGRKLVARYWRSSPPCRPILS